MNNKDINNKFFQKLIERYLEGETTSDELKLLVNYYESFQKENEWVEALGPENILKERMLSNILDAIKAEDSRPSKVILLFNRKIVKYAVAASVVIFLSLTVWFNRNNTPINSPILEPVIVNNNIDHGYNKAILKLENGNEIALEQGTKYQSENAASNGEEIIYQTSKKPTNEISYNFLTIPRGGQFFVKLADGTEVWLNSESQLKYPVTFTDGMPRKVDLLYGEAYFDVSPSTAHNGSKFMVTHNNHEIEVLGTEFNLKAYNDESNTVTTLVHGKVRVNYNGERFDLMPNQQSNINNLTKEISIYKVDSYYETSWKSGTFRFENKSLKEIMKVLSRWYDFEIVFKNKQLETLEFMGSLGKDQNIEDIIYNIKDLGIIKNFKIENKTITIE